MMNLSRLLSVILALPFLGMSGCTTVPSEDVRTSGIRVFIIARDTGTGVIRHGATLRVGGGLSNTYVRLAKGESITADFGGEQKTLRAVDGLFGDVSYVAEHAAVQPGGPYKVRYQIRRRGEPPVVAEVRMPEAFELSSPARSETYRYTADGRMRVALVEVGYGFRDTSLRISVQCDASDGKGARRQLSGALSRVLHAGEQHLDIPFDQIIQAALKGSTGQRVTACEGKLILERINEGAGPAYFSASTVRGVQERERAFRLIVSE